MSSEQDSPNEKEGHEKITVVLTIAHWLNKIDIEVEKQTKLPRKKLLDLAEYLDETQLAYYPYAVLDGLSLSYSMFKYVVDVFISNNDSDLQHELLMTPAGIAVITAESLLIIGFSFLSSHFDSKNSTDTQKRIAKAWPYARNMMKGLKNSFKGLRSTFLVGSLLTGQSMFFVLVPISLVIGLMIAADRYWLRSMQDKRKSQQNNNDSLSDKIEALEQLTTKEHSAYLNEIGKQSGTLRKQAMTASFFNGLIDSMYLYAVLLTLASLSSVALWPMAFFCSIYMIGCVVTRLYEEYEFQKKLVRSQLKCELALINKHCDTLKQQQDKDSDKSQDEKTRIKTELTKFLWEFTHKISELQNCNADSYKLAVLKGIRHGLYAFGALASSLFAVTMILNFAHIAFPPSLLITSVISGTVFIAIFISHELLVTWRQKNDAKETQHPLNQNQIEDLIKCGSEQFKEKLQRSIPPDPPQYFFQQWFEIIRSFFSGFGKGQKIIEFVLNFLQEADENGHYHDTPIMLVFIVIAASLFAPIWALRALAKYHGKNTRNTTTDEEPKERSKSEPSTPQNNRSLSPDPVPPPSRLHPDHIMTRGTSCPNLRFFSEKPASLNDAINPKPLFKSSLPVKRCSIL